MKTTLDDKFIPTGSVFKKYYGKPIEDRTLIFWPILLKYIGPSHFVHIGSRWGDFCPPLSRYCYKNTFIDMQGLRIKKMRI